MITFSRVKAVRGAALIGGIALFGLLALIGLASLFIGNAASGLIVQDAARVSPADVVIVPGALVNSNGAPSHSLQGRIDAAVDLYEAGTVEHLLMSGDNGHPSYNEPAAMRDAAVVAGVPPGDVSIDYAGFDTWDTCIRAHEQFGVTSAVVVTQHQYAERAAALCDAAGIDVTVLSVDPPRLSRSLRLKAQLREPLAKVKAVADIAREPNPAIGGPLIGLVGSEGMPEGGHPPDWNWTTNSPG